MEVLLGASTARWTALYDLLLMGGKLDDTEFSVTGCVQVDCRNRSVLIQREEGVCL